jgi:glucose-6-phosphate dehydrogenase assembly protein OpcA
MITYSAGASVIVVAYLRWLARKLEATNVPYLVPSAGLRSA